jgi:hypothetical protein
MDQKGNIHQIRGTQLLKRIRLAAVAIGKDTLGFLPTKIGLHSARSRAAMAMYFSGTPVYTIMLLGRWSSNAFLKYIRKQIKEFSKGVSKKKLTKEKFFTIPSSNNNNQSKRQSSNNYHQNNGLCFDAVSRSLIEVIH